MSSANHGSLAVMFLISQVGDDPKADKFLQSLQGDIALERVLFRTAGETTNAPSEVCRSILKVLTMSFSQDD